MELYIWVIMGIIVGWLASLSRLYNFFDADDDTVTKKRNDATFKEKIATKNIITSLVGSVIAGLLLHLFDKQNLDFSGQITNLNLSSALTRFDLMVVLVCTLGGILALVIKYSIWRSTKDND